ncbi:MAG: peptidoglycan-binding protein [Bacteroidales bacterium]|nr:peptidoglycan-binding protein [Bacteroidales bacterium]
MDELVRKLKNNGYLHDSHSATQSGYALYDGEVEQAVKYLQEERGDKVTGVFSSSESTSISPTKHHHLGTRDLRIGYEGDDVSELITLLTKAGFAPDSSKVKTGQKEYSEAVADAVRVFQAFTGLEPTGIANLETIKKLKTYKK